MLGSTRSTPGARGTHRLSFATLMGVPSSLRARGVAAQEVSALVNCGDNVTQELHWTRQQKTNAMNL